MSPSTNRSNHPNHRQHRHTLSPQTLIWFTLGMLLLCLPLMLNVVNRVQAERKMREAVTQMSAQVQVHQERLKRLETAETYARSDAYVERWARVQQHWVKNGEVAVIVPGTGPAQTQPQPWWEQFLNQ